MDTSKYGIGYYPAPGRYLGWAGKDHIEKAPRWCSVDLRDGNQSLVIPCLLYTSPSPRDGKLSRMPSSA